MKRFCGRATRDGSLLTVVDGQVTAPINYLKCRILYRGYLADRKELATALGVDHVLGENDAQLIAGSYRKWGIDLTKHVLGEYAVFLFDEISGASVLTHDSLGLAPVFYSISNGELVFGTHLIDIVDAAAVSDIDEDYIADLIATGSVISERTPYRPIKRLLPGKGLIWCNGCVRHARAWDLAQVKPQIYRHDLEYEERFRALVTAGVRASIGEQGQTWVELSGGLDSSTVASIGATQCANRFGAISWTSPGFPECNEVHWMREVVGRYQLPWYPVDIETVLPFSSLPDGILAEPSWNVINTARHRMMNKLLASHNVATLLNGDGGDTILGAASLVPGHLADHLFCGRPLACLRGLNSWAKAAPGMRPWSYWLLRGIVEPACNHLGRLRVETGVNLPLPHWIEPKYANQMQLLARDRRCRATRCLQPGRQVIWDTIWAWTLFVGAWPATAQNHEVRSPLLYRPLVEFMCAIPWEQRLQPNCSRYLQRRALRGILPERVRQRRSKTVGTRPLVEGLRRSKQWISYLCDDPQIPRLGITRPDHWRAAIKQACVGQTFGDRYFLAGVAIEAWLKSLAAWRSENCRQRSRILSS